MPIKFGGTPQNRPALVKIFSIEAFCDIRRLAHNKSSLVVCVSVVCKSDQPITSIMLSESFVSGEDLSVPFGSVGLVVRLFAPGLFSLHCNFGLLSKLGPLVEFLVCAVCGWHCLFGC